MVQKERPPLLVDLKEAAFINVFPLKGAKERGHLILCPTPHLYKINFPVIHIEHQRTFVHFIIPHYTK